MATTDDARRALFTRLVGVLGEAEAVTLMDQLPPAGEAVVSKANLDAVEQRLQQRIDAVEQRVEQRIDVRAAELRAEMQALHARSVRVFVVALVLSNATIAALAFAAAGG